VTVQSANVLSPGILILLPALNGTSIVPTVKPGTAAALHRILVSDVKVVEVKDASTLVRVGNGIVISNRFALAPLPLNAVFNCCIDANDIFIIL
jgi:hypothetical protein